MSNLPRVGARIRVAVISPDLETCTSEGVVIGTSRDDIDGSLATLRITDTLSSTVRVSPGQGYYATWMEIEQPEPSLPAEPALGHSLVRVGEGPSTRVFRRTLVERDPRWVEQSHDGQDWFTWAAVCALGTPVPLVAAPDLAELVEALRKTVVRLHNDHCHGDDFAQCEEHHCAYRTLLARHTGEQVSGA